MGSILFSLVSLCLISFVLSSPCDTVVLFQCPTKGAPSNTTYLPMQVGSNRSTLPFFLLSLFLTLHSLPFFSPSVNLMDLTSLSGDWQLRLSKWMLCSMVPSWFFLPSLSSFLTIFFYQTSSTTPFLVQERTICSII